MFSCSSDCGSSYKNQLGLDRHRLKCAIYKREVVAIGKRRRELRVAEKEREWKESGEGRSNENPYSLTMNRIVIGETSSNITSDDEVRLKECQIKQIYSQNILAK